MNIATRSRWSRRSIALALSVALVASAAACSSGRDIRSGLPAEWEGEGVWDMSIVASVRIEPDQSAMLRNVRVWSGDGECEDEEPSLYSGPATWEWDGGFTMTLPDRREVTVWPSVWLGDQVWSKIGVMTCGPESSPDRVMFLVGGGPDGQIEDPVDG